jgi:SWIM zinc finger
VIPSSSAGISSSYFERTLPFVMRYARPTQWDGGVGSSRSALRFSPNLARESVGFDGSLKDPLALREAMLALHAVVTSDDRFKRRGDPERYAAWQQRQRDEETQIARAANDRARDDAATDLRTEPEPQVLKKDFERARKRYWSLRHGFVNDLWRTDPSLWRAIMPSDPLVTVAPDVVMFEGLSKDTSSWGLVLVERGAFASSQDAVLGTTNVDYSPALFRAMQSLRSYRETRFGVDPRGLDVSVGEEAMREEKIELPAAWLKAFGQISSCLFLADRRVRLPVDVLASVLGHLKRHREKAGPRALRFELEPGRAPAIVIEPWGVRVQSSGPAYDGPRAEHVKVWGRRRLMALSGTLARVHSFGPGTVDVQLLGSGLPSIWTVNVGGGVRFVLGLSGWTQNDWSGAARLDLLAAGALPDPALVQRCAQILQQTRASSVDDLVTATQKPSDAVRAAVVELARLGQVVGDPTSGSVRFRSVIDGALSKDLLGDDPPELREGRALLAQGAVRITSDELASVAGSPKRAIKGRAGTTECEGLLDADGQLTRARCGCSWFTRFGIKKGPCRHLLALRLHAMRGIQ